jgi:hypothetical protein
MYTLQMRRYHTTWTIACHGSFTTCRRMMFRWLAYGYVGETEIVAAR